MKKYTKSDIITLIIISAAVFAAQYLFFLFADGRMFMYCAGMVLISAYPLTLLLTKKAIPAFCFAVLILADAALLPSLPFIVWLIIAASLSASAGAVYGFMRAGCGTLLTSAAGTVILYLLLHYPLLWISKGLLLPSLFQTLSDILFYPCLISLCIASLLAVIITPALNILGNKAQDSESAES